MRRPAPGVPRFPSPKWTGKIVKKVGEKALTNGGVLGIM